MANDIYRILYVESSAEKVTQLKQLIRVSSVESKITFDVATTDSVDGIKMALTKEGCDLILLQDSPKVPDLKEITEAIGMQSVPVLVLVAEEQFLEKRQIMMQDGALDVGSLQQSDVLFKQIVRAIFERKNQQGYRETLEKNAQLAEITAQLAAQSEDLIAYFGATDGLFLYANEAFLKYFGWQDFNELAATTALEYIGAEQSASFKKMMKIASKTGKEQQATLNLINPRSGEAAEEVVTIKPAMHQELPCLEIFVAQSNDGQTAPVVVEATPSLASQFYNRLAFIENLSNFVGSSSWLVSLVLEDYFNFRKKYGVEVLESYFLGLAKHLDAQISNLHYARYSDESMVLLLTNSDMTKVDRLGMAIVASAEGYVFKAGDVSFHGSFSFSYTNLGDSVEGIIDACARLDDLSGLLETRVVFTDKKEESTRAIQAVQHGVEILEVGDIDEEYMPLFTALNDQHIRQTYIPVADFLAQGKENYVASFSLRDAQGNPVVWNRSFTFTSDNVLMRDLDQFMLSTAAENLAKVEGGNKRILVPLSMYFLTKPEYLMDWIEQNAKAPCVDHQIIFGLAEEVVDEHFEAAKHFFHVIADAGFAGMVYDVVDITSTMVTELDVVMVALSENCIGRMSRSISSDEMIKLPKLLQDLERKGAGLMATGVNSPTSMTLVWEYTIPYASGTMIGAVTESLDFDFSQVIM